MSVLTKEQVAEYSAKGGNEDELIDSHEELRAENNRLRAQVKVLREECRAWRSVYDKTGPEAFADEVWRVGHCEDAYEILHRGIGVALERARTATDREGALDE